MKEKLYTILSLYDPEPSLNQKHLTALMDMLIKSCDQNEKSLDRFRLLSCLLGRKDNYLINQFIIIDNQVQKQKMNTLGDSTLQPLEDCQQTQADLLSMCMYADRHKAWRQLLITILQQRQHFLDQIVVSERESCHTLVKGKERRLCLTPHELALQAWLMKDNPKALVWWTLADCTSICFLNTVLPQAVLDRVVGLRSLAHAHLRLKLLICSKVTQYIKTVIAQRFVRLFGVFKCHIEQFSAKEKKNFGHFSISRVIAIDVSDKITP